MMQIALKIWGSVFIISVAIWLIGAIVFFISDGRRSMDAGLYLIGTGVVGMLSCALGGAIVGVIAIWT